MATTTHRNSLEAPAWSGMEDALRQIALSNDVDIKIDSTGFLTRTYYYTVTGEESNVFNFRRQLVRAVDNYNRS